MAKLKKAVKQTQVAGEQVANAGHWSTATSKTHSFSRTIAQEHGEKAAVILQYLAYHIAKSKQNHQGKKWFFTTLDDLAAVFPYLKRSTIHDTLTSLKDKGVLRIGGFNKKGYDRTCWYAFEDDAVRKQSQSSEPVYFKVEDAVKYGIVAAVLLGNLEYWIRENRKEDPGYKWHEIQPGVLSEHLPFSKSTIQRALRMLVEERVLRCNTKPGKGQTVRYALVDEKRIQGGSKPDMGGGSKSDMPGSKPDLGGSFSDMGGSKSDNNTILIENPLVDPCLKEPSYVDAGLPTQPAKSLTSDKLKQVKDVHPFAKPIFKTAKASGDQSSKGTGSANLTESGQAGNLQKSSSSKESPELVALSSSQSSIPTSPPSAPTSESDRFTSGPRSRTRVKLSKSLEDVFYKRAKMLHEWGDKANAPVELVYRWIEQFFQETAPEELLQVCGIVDQQALYDKLVDLFAPHLAKHVDCLSEDPDTVEVIQFLGKLVMQFLTQAFCQFDDDRYYSPGTPHPYKISLMLRQRLQPYFDAREEERRKKLKDSQERILKERAQQYQSPDKAKETRADLSAAEKVQVLRNALNSINSTGAFDDNKQLHHKVVDYNSRTLEVARQFFQTNPDFTVSHLLAVLGKCLELPKERDFREEGNDPLWHARKGRDISFLLQHLDIIVQSLGCVDEIGHFQPVPKGTAAKRGGK